MGNSMSEKEYENQRKKEADVARQLAIADVKEWLQKLPKAKQEKAAIVVGTRSFTPAQIAKEVEEDTEYGKQFAKMLQRSRMELTKRRKQ